VLDDVATVHSLPYLNERKRGGSRAISTLRPDSAWPPSTLMAVVLFDGYVVSWQAHSDVLRSRASYDSGRGITLPACLTWLPFSQRIAGKSCFGSLL
jgi:hypothetical protein